MMMKDGEVILGVPMVMVDRLGGATPMEPIMVTEPRDWNRELWDELIGECDEVDDRWTLRFKASNESLGSH